MFFDQSPKTFCIKSKIFVLVQNEFGPIEGQGIKLKFFTPLQLQFDVKKQSLSFYNHPPQRISIRFKSAYSQIMLVFTKKHQSVTNSLFHEFMNNGNGMEIL